MPDLDVRITSMYPPGVQGGIRAYASATIAGCFAVRGIKIVEGGKDGLFMSMPSRKTQDGYKDICFPVTEEFRNELKQAQKKEEHILKTHAGIVHISEDIEEKLIDLRIEIIRLKQENEILRKKLRDVGYEI